MFALTHLPLNKMAAFPRQHFHEWKFSYFDSHFIEVCTLGSNQQFSSIGSDNGLAPIKRQAIICTNADPVHWHIYAALGEMS